MTAQEIDLTACVLFCEADGRFKTRKAAEEVIMKVLVAEGVTHPAPFDKDIMCPVCDSTHEVWRKKKGPSQEESGWYNQCETCGTCWSID